MIYTSYFTMAGKIPATLRKLSIASSKKITLDGRIDALAPSWALVSGYKDGKIFQTEYVEQYNAQLTKLDPSIVPDNSVLFCFEKPGDFCHRHLVSAWLRQHGIPCVEYGTTALERLQQTVTNATAGMIKCGITDVGGDPATTDVWMDNYEKYGCKLAVIVSKGLPTKKGQDWLLEHKDNTLFHATITGWGGTSVEEGVRPWREQLGRVNAFVAQGYHKDHVIIRVDPILLCDEGIQRAKAVMQAAADEGYTNIKYSWCDTFYDHAKARFQVIDMPVPASVDSVEGQKLRNEMMSFIFDVEKKYGIRFTTCAEKKNPHYAGCVDEWTFEKCGRSASEVVGNANQRGECGCSANKVELIPYSEISKCPHKCVYCFCKHTPFDTQYGIRYVDRKVDWNSVESAKKAWNAQHTVQQVPAFRGERFYLSNMYEYPMDINGMEFSCVEAAFQSFKTKDLELRKKFVGLNGYEAKKLGRRIALRKDWDQVKVKVMRQLIQCKFSLKLGDKLAKEQGELVETNTWGDTFWGVCNGVGQNWLGKLLMQVREQKQQKKTICVTGHRPNKLFDYDTNSPAYDNLRKKLRDSIEKHCKKGPIIAYSGMALGVDTLFVEECLKLKKHYDIKVIAAVPFKGQEIKWSVQAQKHYHELLKQVDDVYYVSDPGYSPEKMQKRNEFMVNHSDYVIAVYDGTAGGTQNCVKYAQEQGKEIELITPKEDTTPY